VAATLLQLTAIQAYILRLVAVIFLSELGQPVGNCLRLASSLPSSSP